MLSPESPESSDSEESWTHVEGRAGHGSKPLPDESHDVSPESDQGQGSSEGASLLLNTPTQTFEAAQFRSLVEGPPGKGLDSCDGEVSKSGDCAQAAGAEAHTLQGALLPLSTGQAGTPSSPTALPAGNAAPAHTSLAGTSSPRHISYGSSSQPGTPCSVHGEVPELTRAAGDEAEASSLPSVDLRGFVMRDDPDEESTPPSLEREQGEGLAEEGGPSSSGRWWRFGSHSGPTPSLFAEVMDGVPMQGEDSNDGQGGDGHSEGSGDTPVMVHGIAELEADSEVEERQAREFRRASMTIEDIRRARQPINPAPRRTHTYMKIMLVGAPGLGKTTFMQMLQQQVSSVSERYEEDEQACLLKQRAEATPGEYLDIQAKLEQHFVADPAAFSCILEHVDGPFSYTYTLQDIPGLLAFTDCPVAHVRHQLAAWRAVKMADEEGPDPRVDVCLYFMSPEGLRAQDVEAMAQLSEWTSVVPIIARADSLAPEGLAAYRKQVVACLEAASTVAGRQITWTLPEALRSTVRATADHIMPPFAIISSTTFDDEFGSFWPVRHFAWGTAAAMNTEYSDLPMLRDFLFNVGLDHVKRETNAYYSKFCKGQPDEAATPTTSQVARGVKTCKASRPSQGRGPIWWRRLRLKAQPLRRWAAVVGLGVLGFWAASATVAALHNGRALAASRVELERHRTLSAEQNQVPALPQVSLLAPPADIPPSARAGQVEEVAEAARLAAETAGAAPASESSEVWADVASSLHAMGADECKEATPLSGSNTRNAAGWASALLRTSLNGTYSLAQMADRAVREKALPAVTSSAAVVGQAVMEGSREAAAVSQTALQRAGRDMAGAISQTQQAAGQAGNWVGASTAQIGKATTKAGAVLAHVAVHGGREAGIAAGKASAHFNTAMDKTAVGLGKAAAGFGTAGKQTLHSSLTVSQAVGRVTWQLGADAGAATKHATSATVKYVAATADTVGRAVAQQVTSVFKQAPKEVAAAAQQAGQAASEAGAYAEEQLSKVPGFKLKTEEPLQNKRRIWKALLIAASAAGALLSFTLL